MIQICRHLLMKVWTMCCLNIGTSLIIYKSVLDFLHFAKDFEQNFLKSCKIEWDNTKNNVLSS